MGRKRARLARTVRQVRDGELDLVSTDARAWAWSERVAFGLRRDLSIHREPPGRSGIELEAVPLEGALVGQVFDTAGLDDRDRALLERRRAIWEAGIAGAWVAVDPGGRPAYLQWFIPHTESAKVRSYWGSLFPVGDHQTILVEGAWVPPSFRGRRVMSDGFHLLTEAAAANAPADTRWCLTYVEADNGGALRGSRDAGYEVVERRTECWRLGRRLVRFEPIDAEAEVAGGA